MLTEEAIPLIVYR